MRPPMTASDESDTARSRDNPGKCRPIEGAACARSLPVERGAVDRSWSSRGVSRGRANLGAESAESRA
jgi:hypothetical protein